MQSDKDIVNLCLNDGIQHFEKIIKLYNNYVFGVMMRVTAGNIHFSEDLTQLAFIRAMKYLRSYDQEKELKTWLVQIAINCFKTEIKKNNKYVSIDNANEPVTEIKDDDEFYEMIATLSSTERIIFTLKYVYEYKNEDIGNSLSINTNTVKSIIKRALEKLR
ncbi:MAG: RNA polymerase sigma factor [Gammaproteobacteria bacterium]|tara:strand:- start:12317 stop:12802 length:486 start_codon:yes stop_codon:yes gene_type:complete